MRNRMKSALLFALMSCGAWAQEGHATASANVWLDTFGTSQGAVIYPQYSWTIHVPNMKVSGYGYVESAPGEALFTNNLVVFTAPKVPWFSVHTEVGGALNQSATFVQIGPRFNATDGIPRLRGVFEHLFAAVLPRFEGVRLIISCWLRGVIASGSVRFVYRSRAIDGSFRRGDLTTLNIGFCCI
jgi:hypothetical protein